MKIGLGWSISSYFGWGVYALNLALEWAGNPEIEAQARIDSLDHVVVDRLRRHALAPFMRRSVNPSNDAIRIDALGNDAVGATDAKLAAIFFEMPLSNTAVVRLKRYDAIVAGSSWNAEMLQAMGLTNVKLSFQGVDRSLFHPAPKRRLYRDKFLIFSGGKAEPRKGQDLVVKAFTRFASRHSDAVLVTAWHSPWPKLRDGMDLDLSSVADRVIDVGQVPNGQMASVYRECDIGLFPNRAEGGTNLVAMECLACGVPVILSANTGHLDLLEAPGTFGLRHQKYNQMEWGESDLDEMIEALEVAYRVRASEPRQPLPSNMFNWADAAKVIADLARNQEVMNVAA